MKKIIFLTALLLSQNVESKEDFHVVNCGRNDVMFSIGSFPFGLSIKEICACSKKNWRGMICDVEFRNQLLANEIARKNSATIDKILKGIKYELEL
jgi:hypothetical protein